MIIRTPHRRRYTSVANQVLEDERLSFRARGVLLWLLAKPNDWLVNSSAIATAGTEGRDAIRTALGELERFGYLLRSQLRDPATGRFRTVVDVVECPQCDRAAEESPGHTGDGFPGPGDAPHGAKAQVAPGTGYPASGNQAPGNQAPGNQAPYQVTKPKSATHSSVPPAAGAAAPPMGEQLVLGEDGPGPRATQGELFAAVAAACAMEARTLTRTERTVVGRIAKELAAVGATSAEVARRAARYRRDWPDVKLTPAALAAKWSLFGRDDRAPPGPPRVAPTFVEEGP